MRNPEQHFMHRIGMLRAAVLGANDGIVSIASLIIGVAAAEVATGNIVIAGVAGLVAGAMSMSAGEYVSVSSQADTERADLERERIEHASDGDAELEELALIYVERGLDHELATEVAVQMTAHDALGSHARDELGILDIHSARPMQAAIVSAIAFAIGAAMPLLTVVLIPGSSIIINVAITSLVFLGILGALGAHAGGASRLRGAIRVILWGAMAMLLTAGVGALFGIAA